jgi:PIN domain nuclease of toxin-antitoxin system
MKSFLLDSCTLLWATIIPEKLSERVKNIIEDADNLLSVSHVTIWELSIKESLGKLTLPQNFFEAIEPAGYFLLPTAMKHFAAYRKLPKIHSDPFDRMLIAQSIAENIPLITCDSEIIRYDVEVMW